MKLFPHQCMRAVQEIFPQRDKEPPFPPSRHAQHCQGMRDQAEMVAGLCEQKTCESDWIHCIGSDSPIPFGHRDWARIR